MFTGIIRHVGQVRAVRRVAEGARLAIDVGPLAEGLGLGDSVAVSGACLTVVSLSGSEASFDVTAETLSRTTLGSLRAGAKVNLERSLGVSDALDGHLVQGHVDGVAVVQAVGRGADPTWAFSAPEELIAQMVPKGSVAVDGVSLTLVDVAENRFTVSLIPATLEATTLGARAIGDRVNIETDVIGKYVLRYVRRIVPQEQGGLSMETLRRGGFC